MSTVAKIEFEDVNVYPIIGYAMLGFVLGSAWGALLLADIGHFFPAGALLIGTLSGILVAVVGVRLRRRQAMSRCSVLARAFALCVAVSSLFLTLPPSEMILGGWDPGVYLHTGAAVANGGNLQVVADDIWLLPEGIRESLTRNASGWEVSFMGMYPLPNGRFSPQFMHLYPSLLGVAYAMAGVWGALLVNPLLNATTLLIMFRFASKIVGNAWGVTATLLLALNPAQIWQGKFGTAEMLTQVLLLCGFSVLLSACRKPGGVLPAVGAGISFGLAFLARYDVILVVVPVVLVLAAFSWEPGMRRVFLGFLAGMCPLALHAVLRMIWVAPTYRVVPHLVLPALAGAIVVTVFLFFVAQTSIGEQLARMISARARSIRGMLALVFLAYLVWAWYVRPHLAVDGRVSGVLGWVFNRVGWSDWKAALVGTDAWNIRYLTSLFGIVGLVTGCAGIVTLIWRSKDRGVLVWLLASLTPLVVLTSCLFHDHFMMWASRRFVPVILPLFCIAIVAAAWELHRWLRARWSGLAIPVSGGLLVCVLFGNASGSFAMAEKREWPGLVRWYDDVVEMIPPNAIVLCDQPGFAAPLRFLYGVHAHEVYGGCTATQVLAENLSEVRNIGRTVCVFTMRPQPAANGIQIREIGHAPLWSHILEQPKYLVPKRTKGRGGNFVLWQVNFDSVGEDGRMP